MQHLLHLKVAKAESYLIGGYHNEWLELTYYIETLGKIIIGNRFHFQEFQILKFELGEWFLFLSQKKYYIAMANIQFSPQKSVTRFSSNSTQ